MEILREECPIRFHRIQSTVQTLLTDIDYLETADRNINSGDKEILQKVIETSTFSFIPTDIDKGESQKPRSVDFISPSTFSNTPHRQIHAEAPQVKPKKSICLLQIFKVGLM